MVFYVSLLVNVVSIESNVRKKHMLLCLLTPFLPGKIKVSTLSRIKCSAWINCQAEQRDNSHQPMLLRQYHRNSSNITVLIGPGFYFRCHYILIEFINIGFAPVESPLINCQLSWVSDEVKNSLPSTAWIGRILSTCVLFILTWPWRKLLSHIVLSLDQKHALIFIVLLDVWRDIFNVLINS